MDRPLPGGARIPNARRSAGPDLDRVSIRADASVRHRAPTLSSAIPIPTRGTSSRLDRDQLGPHRRSVSRSGSSRRRQAHFNATEALDRTAGPQDQDPINDPDRQRVSRSGSPRRRQVTSTQCRSSSQYAYSTWTLLSADREGLPTRDLRMFIELGEREQNRARQPLLGSHQGVRFGSGEGGSRHLKIRDVNISRARAASPSS
jgi:hypothetical protein